jgi:hypothetical protein
MRPEKWYETKLKENGYVIDCQLICPHCFKVNDDTDLDLGRDGDQERDIPCEECGEKMDIKVEVSKTYKTRKAKIGSW